jgi:hypothetical protein
MPPEKYRAGIFTCQISDLLFATRTDLPNFGFKPEDKVADLGRASR